MYEMRCLVAHRASRGLLEYISGRSMDDTQHFIDAIDTHWMELHFLFQRPLWRETVNVEGL